MQKPLKGCRRKSSCEEQERRKRSQSTIAINLHWHHFSDRKVATGRTMSPYFGIAFTQVVIWCHPTQSLVLCTLLEAQYQWDQTGAVLNLCLKGTKPVFILLPENTNIYESGMWLGQQSTKPPFYFFFFFLSISDFCVWYSVHINIHSDYCESFRVNLVSPDFLKKVQDLLCIMCRASRQHDLVEHPACLAW